MDLAVAQTALEKSFSRFSETYVILDGLDECVLESKQDLSTFINKLQHSACKLLASSRPSQKFQELFRDCARLKIEAKSLDIDRFIKASLLGHPLIRGMVDGALETKIIEALQKGAAGA
jgi:hypothetical protein